MKAIENKQFLCPDKKFWNCLLNVVINNLSGLQRNDRLKECPGSRKLSHMFV